MTRVSVLLPLVAMVLLALPPSSSAVTTPANGSIVFSRYDPRVDDSFTYIVDATRRAQGRPSEPALPAAARGPVNLWGCWRE